MNVPAVARNSELLMYRQKLTGPWTVCFEANSSRKFPALMVGLSTSAFAAACSWGASDSRRTSLPSGRSTVGARQLVGGGRNVYFINTSLSLTAEHTSQANGRSITVETLKRTAT